MRAVVTGVGGFLGRHLCDRLPTVYPERVELRNRASVLRAMSWRPSVVFHLAAMSDPRLCEADPESCHAVNVEGTRMLAQAADCTLVVVSTVHVYGAPMWLPVTEHHPLVPKGVYARSKAQAEQVASGAIIARIFNLTGPGQGAQFAPADWARQSWDEGPIDCGNLDVERDYLDVRDAADGLLALAREGQPGQAYNLCSGRAVAMRWILEQLAPGREVRVDPARERPEVPVLLGSNDKARGLGWEPRIPLEQSLADLRASVAPTTED